MRILYKLVIVAVVYIGSVFFFAGNMEENIYTQVKDLTYMSDATLPVISLRVDDNDINRLHGYCSATEEMLIRESMTPITSEQIFTVVINESDYIIRKINYEIFNAQNGQKADEGSVIAFDKEEDYKTAKIKIKEVLNKDTEYVLKISLISNESKRIYYYTRLIVIDNANLTEKLQFVDELQNDLFSKNTENNFKKYLEYKAGADNSSFARVNIYSGEDMVSFGQLDLSMIYKEFPTITEFSKDTASVVLSYYISINKESGTEYYHVKDYYRFGYTSIRVYLYNFEREMESVFMPELASLSKSEFKIGITGNYDINFYVNTSENIMAFVRERELWSYDASNNIITKVFSFKQKESDYIRDVFDQHDVKVMNMDELGNIDFMVYGYMNRGEYEGRVGIVIYRYNKLLGIIEEKAYIPMNTTYQILNKEIGDVVFYNQFDVAYFEIFDTIYSYNFVSKVLNVLASNTDAESMVFSEKGKYVVWQNSRKESNSITILMLDTGNTTTVYAGKDEYVKVLTTVDENFIYGFVKEDDIAITNIGTVVYPMYKICLSNRNAEVLREYEKEGYYVVSAEASENKITLYRVEKSDGVYSGYKDAKTDHMLNSGKTEKDSYRVTTRVTDIMLTEYYIAIPSQYSISQIPDIQSVKNAVIKEDTTLRITRPDSYEKHYYAYSFGRIILSSTVPGAAVSKANKAVGSVIDSNGKIIWQRGAKGSKNEIAGITPVYANDTIDSMQAVLKMLFQYKGMDVDTSVISRQNKSVMEYIEYYLKIQSLNLSGASLDEILYMVYNNRPVIAIMDDNKAVLITGYDSHYVTVINPSSKRTEKISINEAENMFEKAGNVFISYMD